jgi:putative SOS response-associated peptidase YedK
MHGSDANRKIPPFIPTRDDSPMPGFGKAGKVKRRPSSLVRLSPPAHALVAELHHRMSVILDSEHFDWWMTGAKDEIWQLLVPGPAEELAAYPISRQVNNPRNEGPELLRPAV